MKKKARASHEDVMVKKLRRDPEFAAAYLRAAMEDSDEPQVLLIALRQVAKARGMASVARRAKIERESLYRALSPKGNPRFSTIAAVTKALGLTLSNMSDRTNVSLGYLSQIELGKNSASIETLYRICLALGMKMSELFQAVQRN